MHGLLLAEKPSLMRAIKEVYDRNPGILPDTLDFGAFHGHLMALNDPADYDPAWEDRRNAAILPMIPDQFVYHVEDKESVDRLMAKIRAGHYDFLVNACDAGREGEHIFWSFYETTGLKLPVKRLWAKSVTVPALKAALADLKDSALYDNMRTAAKLRAQFDWLVGMNFTRAATIATQRFTTIGRVQTPTLKIIVDRELEIRNFKPEKFFEVKCTGTINGTDVPGFLYLIPPKYTESRIMEKKEAEGIVSKVKASPNGEVIAVKETVKEVEAPTLLSLAELEKSANKTYKFKLKHTDELAQSLYEAGYISYPRSESRFLPTDMIPELGKHISSCTAVPELAQIAAGIGQAEIDAMTKKKYVDDAGITDHHAIIPTDSKPDWSKLSPDEQKLYTLVCKSFLAIFLPPYRMSSSSVIIQAGGYAFGAKGRQELDKGYMVLYPDKKTKDTILPVCKQGDKASVKDLKITEGTTKAPPRFSPSDVIEAMQTAGNKLSNAAMRSILKDTVGLGTSASRSEIVKKLEDRKFIELKSNVYWATDEGIRVIADIGDRNFASPMLTAQWEEKLQAIEAGKFKGDFRSEMETYVKDETSYLLSNLKASPNVNRVVGKCPVCGGDIIERANSFMCSNHKKDTENSCWLWIPKTIGGAQISENDVAELLQMHEIGPMSVTTKTGRKVQAYFFLKEGTGVMARFEDNSVGTCPICGGRIIAYPNSYSCEHNRKDDPNACGFWIPTTIGGAKVSEADVKQLLTERKLGPKQLTRKDKTKWKAYIILKEDNTLGLESAEPRPQELPGTVCPVCGGRMIAFKNAYICENRKKDDPNSCTFWIPKELAGASISDAEAVKLINDRKIGPKEITKKDKTKWKVNIILNEDNTFNFENAEERAEKVQIGVCPVCGKPVYESRNSFYCAGNTDKSCSFSFPKLVKGAQISTKDMKDMLAGKKTRAITFVWNSGKTGQAMLYLQNGKLQWEFLSARK